MVVLREAEAVGYLERLAETLNRAHPAIESDLLYIFRAQHFYFQRLSRNPETQSSVTLSITPSGFPDLRLVMADIEKANAEAEELKASIYRSYNDLHGKLRYGGGIADFSNGINTMMGEYDEVKEYLELLRVFNASEKISLDPIKPRYKKGEDIPTQIYTLPDKSELLFFNKNYNLAWNTTNRWTYDHGFVKYIDSEKGDPYLLEFKQQVDISPSGLDPDRGQLRFFLKTPKNQKITDFLSKLDGDFLERFLLIDFTTLPEGSFDEFILYTRSISPLLLKLPNTGRKI